MNRESAAIDKPRAGTEYGKMRLATVRDLRNNFAIIEACPRDGAEVCIKKRVEPVAILTALKRGPIPLQIRNPDFKARRKAVWGERVFSEQELSVLRRDELEGEEG